MQYTERKQVLQSEICEVGLSSAKRLSGVPWDAARNKDHVMVIIAWEDNYTQRERLKSRLGFFRLSNEILALAEIWQTSTK